MTNYIIWDIIVTQRIQLSNKKASTVTYLLFTTYATINLIAKNTSVDGVLSIIKALVRSYIKLDLERHKKKFWKRRENDFKKESTDHDF